MSVWKMAANFAVAENKHLEIQAEIDLQTAKSVELEIKSGPGTRRPSS